MEKKSTYQMEFWNSNTSLWPTSLTWVVKLAVNGKMYIICEYMHLKLLQVWFISRALVSIT